jgi:hypothetical protein
VASSAVSSKQLGRSCVSLTRVGWWGGAEHRIDGSGGGPATWVGWVVRWGLPMEWLGLSQKWPSCISNLVG